MIYIILFESFTNLLWHVCNILEYYIYIYNSLSVYYIITCYIIRHRKLLLLLIVLVVTIGIISIMVIMYNNIL